jgi:hypothetical protein
LQPRPGQTSLFEAGEFDDVVLRLAGERGWFVLGHDYSYHLQENILSAIRDYSVGVFYIWGASAARWDTMRMLVRSFKKIELLSLSTEKPFIYKIFSNGRFQRIL